MRKLTRPALLAGVALAFALCGLFGPTVSGAAAANPIVIENQNAGTTNWQLGRPGFQTADDVNKQIKGYASATSVNKGGSIDFKVSVNPAQTYTIDIYRLGWYGGLGGRLMQHVNSTLGIQQPACPTDATTGLIECNWTTGYTLSVPTSWTTGAYVALLTNANNYQNYVPFVVRDDSGNADLLFQTSVTTYQAYNNYPNDGVTGKSLYPDNSFGARTVSGTKRAVKVSFDRPYANAGVSELLERPDGAAYGYEYHFIRWLEQNGYNVSYSTDIDTHASGANLLTHRGFLSVGHDEYWTKAMRDAAEAARDAGKNLAFFGGNDVYWQIRLEPATTNAAPNRVEVSYKNNAPTLDPVQDETMTTKWRDPLASRPEQQMMGIQSINGAAAHLVNAPYVVQNSSNWIYAGTGFSEGSSVPGIVGYEYERTDPDFAGQTYPSSTIVSHSPVSDGAWSDWAESIVSQAQSGAWVFDAGTIWWGWGLDKSGIVDSRIQQTTANILNRFIAGKIIIRKDSQPDDAQDFSFTTGGGLSPSSFQLDDDADPTLSNTQTFQYVAPGSGYSVSEAVPSGWDQTGATCSDGSSVSNIDVSSGETVTCTFTNRKRGKIVVVEDSQPDDPQDFGFTAGGGLSPSSFSLDDDADGTLSNTRTFSNVVPGSGYSLAETVPSGWDQTSATCDNGSATSNIAVSAGQTVTCTLTNRKRGKVVVLEDSQPNDAQDFSFTAGGGLSPTSFSLDDDANATLSNTQTFNNVVPGGGYSLSQTVPSGWDLTSSTCDDGSPISNVNVSAGETVTCTFVNRKRSQIVVVEDTQPNNGQDFSFTAGGGLSPSSFTLDDDNNPALSNTQTFAGVVPNNGYSISETVPGGWQLATATCDDGSPVSNIDVAPGETVTCTFVNTRRGKIVVVKDAQPNDPQDFAFTAGGGLSPSTFSLDDDSDPALSNTITFDQLATGTYSVSETVPSGWDQTGATCDDGSPVSAINVGSGETVTCTFTNRKRGKIVVVEDSQPDDAQNFSFAAGGGLSPSSFQLDDDLDPALSNTQTFNDVVPGGGYSLSETVPAGWDLSAACDDGSSTANINVAAGETVTCTFTNLKRGSIVVTKDSQPNDPQDFAFTGGGGLSPSSFSLDDDSDPTLSNTRTFGNLPSQNGYSLSETVPSGWDQTGASCDNGSSISNISVAPGQTVTCGFTNRKRGQIVIVKDALPNDPQDFSFSAGGGLSPASFSLDDDSNPTLSNTQTFNNVVPGSGYSISESVPGGWDQTGSGCDDGSALSNIDVSAGETVTCTFTNRKRGNIVVVENSTPNDAQDFSFSAGGGLSPTSFSLDDDSDPTLSNTRTFANVVPSDGYSLVETVPSGWDLTSSTCDNGSTLSNVDVSAGETVTCTFTNRKRGDIVVVENSTPNDPQDFSFSAGGGLSPASFSLDDDSDPTFQNARTFANVVPSDGYSLAETVPSGWDLTSSTCDDGSTLSNIDVSAGETVTCTFNNRKRGNIVVVENSTPNDPQDFSFSAGGGLSPASFSLDDDLDLTLSNTRTFTNVVPGGGYSFDETVPNGWDLTSTSCDDGSALSNIAVSAGETVTCTFDNRKRGNIVVVESSTPNDAQDFAFTAGGGLSPSSLSLDDDADPTLSNTHTFANVVPNSAYSLDETVPSGWDLTSSSCDDGSTLSNIDVAPGETVTCTFNNRKRGSIVVVESSTPNDPQNFDFTAGGGLSPSSFSLDDDSDPTLSNTRTFANVVPGGGYSLDETVPSGWDLTDSSCDDGSTLANIDVAPGETVTCSFNNRKRGQIVVVENSTPNDPQDFSFSAGGGLSPSSFSLDDDSDPTLSNTRTFANVVPGGGYSLGETVPSGWDLTSSACDDGSALSSIDISPGETVTCSFNNRKRGQVVVVENSNPNDPQDFAFSAGGGLSPSTLSLDDDADPTLQNAHTFANVVPGSGYSLSETVPNGWDLTSSSCDDGSALTNIAVAPGETVTCTFDNRKRGNIVVVESSTPNDPQNFDFTAGGGLSPSSFSLDDDSDLALSNTRTFSDVMPGGGYSLDETVPSGWDLTDSSCDDGSALSNIDVSPGETVTCSFSNRKRGNIVVVENSTPNAPQDFGFTAGGGLSPSSFSLDDDSDPTLSNTTTFSDLVPGSGYTLDETVPSNWDLTGSSCDDGSTLSNIDVSAGETVTCTFNNRKRGKVVVVESSNPNDAQDFDFTAGGGLSPTSLSLDDDSDPTLPNTHTFVNVVPGSGYSLAETVPSGWDLTSSTCDDGSALSNIDVAPGETVTCTFDNRKRGNIVVVENSTPNAPQDFGFTAGGGLSPSSFSLDDDSDPTLSNTTTFSDLVPGSGYTLDETVPSNWDLTGSSCDDGSTLSNIDVSAGETVTCTFNNRKRGRVVVVENSTPNDPQDFSFSAGGGLSPSSFSLDDDSDPTLQNTHTFSNVVPAAGYSLSETVPSGWDLTSSTCDDGSALSNIDVAPGETVTCTFDNRKRGKIVVVENSTPNDPQDFSFSAGGGLSPASFSLDDDSDPTLSNIRTFNYVAPGGGYSLSETVPSGWNLSNATCDDGSATSSIDISAGETVTCTFTNEKRGKIIVRKDAQPNDPQDFAFTAGGGLSPSSFSLDDDSDPTLSNTETFDNLIPRNNYSISESVPGSWDQIGATCDNGSPVTNVDVAPAETVTCTFTNLAHGSIVVKLDAQPNHAQDFSFSAGGGLSPTTFSLDDDADPALSNTQTFNSITPGSGYSVSAAVPSGWKQTGNACDDGSPVSNIGVSVGETVTCTFVEVKGYQRPQSGSTLGVSLVPTFKQCGTGGNPVTRKHAPPLNVGSCTTGPTSTLAVAGIQSVGSAHFTVVPGDTNPSNGDQADVQLSTSITDVQSSTGADYTPVTNGPDMTMITRLRITDEQNCSLPCGGSYAQPATLTERDFAVPIDCANTPGSSIGATCTANTTADAISPGMITENRSSIFQAFRVRINDAGANKVRGDADDKLFEQQGFFNP